MEATRDGYEDLLIHTAAAEGAIEKVAELLAQGVSANQPNFHGLSPLHCAAEFGQVDCVRLLLQANADVDLPVNGRGTTASHLAAQGGYSDVLQVLLEGGADVTAKNTWGSTVLKVAKKRNKEKRAGSEQVLAVLAAFGAS
mmetsp:Transcript_79723/g.221884  ORF Transcript_79723/g.221884 Transcript_79723/m.221884 type:complete len:141 (+) Transcript_79723:87-509(+)